MIYYFENNKYYSLNKIDFQKYFVEYLKGNIEILSKKYFDSKLEIKFKNEDKIILELKENDNINKEDYIIVNNEILEKFKFIISKRETTLNELRKKRNNKNEILRDYKYNIIPKLYDKIKDNKSIIKNYENNIISELNNEIKENKLLILNKENEIYEIKNNLKKFSKYVNKRNNEKEKINKFYELFEELNEKNKKLKIKLRTISEYSKDLENHINKNKKSHCIIL